MRQRRLNPEQGVENAVVGRLLFEVVVPKITERLLRARATERIIAVEPRVLVGDSRERHRFAARLGHAGGDEVVEKAAVRVRRDTLPQRRT